MNIKKKITTTEHEECGNTYNANKTNQRRTEKLLQNQRTEPQTLLKINYSRTELIE